MDLAHNAIGLRNVILTGTVIGDGIAAAACETRVSLRGRPRPLRHSRRNAGEESAQLAYYYKAYGYKPRSRDT